MNTPEAVKVANSLRKEGASHLRDDAVGEPAGGAGKGGKKEREDGKGKEGGKSYGNQVSYYC